MNAAHLTSSRLQLACVTLALLIALSWALPVAAASPEKLIEQASTWYSTHCSDPSKELFASSQLNQMLAALQAANEETGEPALLAWHGLLSVCIGDREGGQANTDLFRALAGDVEPALTARIEMELALRDKQCKTASRAARRLANTGKTADDARAVLLARTYCRTECTEVTSAAQRLEEMGGDLSSFANRVDACRTEIANSKRRAKERAVEQKRKAKKLAAEKKRRAKERAAEQERKAAEQKRKAADDRRLAEEQTAEKKKQSEERAARRAALTPVFFEANTKYELIRKKAVPAKALTAIGLAGGGTLAALGLISKVQGAGYAYAAAGAYTGDEYQAQVDLIGPANSRMGVFLGGSAAFLVSGIVGSVIASIQANKSKAIRRRLDALRQELDDIAAQEGE